MSQPFDAKAPKKQKNYIKTPRTYADLSIPPVAAATAGSSSPPSPGQTKLHCLKALRRTEKDTRRHRRVESIAGSPSAGEHPKLHRPWIQAHCRRTTPPRARSNLLHSPIFHKTRSCLLIPKRRGRHTYLLFRPTGCRRSTPEQSSHAGRPTSTGSPSAPEQSTNGARKSPRRLIPPRRHRRRLADVV